MNTIFDNAFNGYFNSFSRESDGYQILEELPKAVEDEDRQAPFMRALASGGEKFYRVQLENPLDNQQTVLVDLYAKGFWKPLKSQNDFRIEAVLWHKPDVIVKGRGHSIQEALDKVINKIFNESEF